MEIFIQFSYNLYKQFKLITSGTFKNKIQIQFLMKRRRAVSWCVSIPATKPRLLVCAGKCCEGFRLGALPKIDVHKETSGRFGFQKNLSFTNKMSFIKEIFCPHPVLCICIYNCDQVQGVKGESYQPDLCVCVHLQVCIHLR